MEYSTVYHPKERYIETTIQGEMSLEETTKMISEILQTARDKNCFLLLNDFRKANLGLSTIQIYDMPKLIANAAAALGLQSVRFKRALVSKTSKGFEFFETVTFNQGQTTHLFQDKAEARQWLLEK